MKICDKEVLIRKCAVTGDMVATVFIDENTPTSFRYNGLEAQTMTMDRLEKKVRKHLKKEGYLETVKEANSCTKEVD